jgi:L-lysine 2,3-aminomutase
MIVHALGLCHPECRFCQREWWVWYRARMAQMHKPKRGEAVSFAQAAATSIGAGR